MVPSVAREKIPSVTPPGIDPETVRLVAPCLNHYATPGPEIILECRIIATVRPYSSLRKSFLTVEMLCLQLSFLPALFLCRYICWWPKEAATCSIKYTKLSYICKRVVVDGILLIFVYIFHKGMHKPDFTWKSTCLPRSWALASILHTWTVSITLWNTAQLRKTKHDVVLLKLHSLTVDTEIVQGMCRNNLWNVLCDGNKLTMKL
jgi:hypothetical protein